MAKYLAKGTDGLPQETTGLVTSSGVANANQIVETGADGRLDNSLLPLGIGVKTRNVVASEALAAGDFVNLFSNAGTINARKANANNRNFLAHGFVISSVASGGTATIYYDNEILTGLTGLTVGARIFLSSTTAGAVTSTAPTTADHVVQAVGTALTATELLVQIERNPIVNI